MKKLLSILIAFALTLGAAACFVGCNHNADEESVATSYIAIDINPSIRLVLDQNQKVVSLSCENDDALTMLYGENLIGLDVGKATEKIMDLSIKMGYLTNDNCGVQVEAASVDSQAENVVRSKVKFAVGKVGESAAFDVKYSDEGSFLLNFQLKKLKENNPDDERYQNLTVGKLRLIDSAMACDLTLNMDETVNMNTSELLIIVDSAYSNLENYSTKAFKQAELAARQVYEVTAASAREAVYLAKYMEFKGPIEGTLAMTQYGGLSLAAKSIDLLARALLLAEDITDKVLADGDAQDIAAKLGINTDIIKDENGEVTARSIGAYVEKCAKNNADKMTQQMREQLTEAVEKLEESKSRLQNKPLSVEAVEKIQALLSKAKIDDVEFVCFTIDDLKEIAAMINEKAAGVKVKMDAKLTDREKSEIATAQEQAVAKLDGALRQYNQAVDKAAQEAKASLQRLKQARLDALAKQA